MKITAPKLQVVRFASEDVIATSALLGPLSGKTGTFYIPVGDFGGSYSGSGSYVEFNGTLGNYTGNGYEITGISGARGVPTSDVDGLKSGGSYYFPDMGVTVDMSDMAPIAKQTYEAFSYGNGVYYTNGASYFESYWQ